MNDLTWDASPTWMHGLDWGTVPTWVSAFLTSGSLLLGFYILLRDRRKEEQQEASQVMCWLEGAEFEGEGRQFVPHVENFADRPVSGVHLVIEQQKRDPDGRRVLTTRRVASMVRPSESEVGQAVGISIDNVRHAYMTFVDSDGTEWIRDVLPDVYGHDAFRLQTLRGRSHWLFPSRGLYNVNLHVHRDMSLSSHARRKGLRRAR
ncbi:hypothetical protein [Streptomyces europaeiscabiei]|uniref:hypothetical protein n=1 Tax=Streptomyces europaeiscabiei TaxID=146819 RepID=UPI0038F5FE50